MARNVEIKARLGDVASVRARAQMLAGGPPQLLLQDDTFFPCAQGRLKLREFADGSAELIHYERGDEGAARLSDYVRCQVSDPAGLRLALQRAHGLHGRVRKRREVWLIGQTRVHLDDVEGLGAFVELEVVLTPHQSLPEGIAIADALLASLGLAGAERIGVAYVDLVNAGADLSRLND